jgi:flavodoxin
MKTGIFYISRTGNTKRLAEAISEMLKAPIFNIAEGAEASIANDFDLLIIGTPVMGLGPAPEVRTFIKRLPTGQDKKTILFCTYAIKQGGTLDVLRRELSEKGYHTILCVSKRGLKLDKPDFSEVLDSIAQVTKGNDPVSPH